MLHISSECERLHPSLPLSHEASLQFPAVLQFLLPDHVGVEVQGEQIDGTAHEAAPREGHGGIYRAGFR